MTLTTATPYYLGSATAPEPESPTGLKLAFQLGLAKQADNRFICPSNKDFWKASDGKIVRTSSDEVDNGEALEAADAASPEAFLASLLENLEF
jgi:hypothetical protein